MEAFNSNPLRMRSFHSVSLAHSDLYSSQCHSYWWHKITECSPITGDHSRLSFHFCFFQLQGPHIHNLAFVRDTGVNETPICCLRMFIFKNAQTSILIYRPFGAVRGDSRGTQSQQSMKSMHSRQHCFQRCLSVLVFLASSTQLLLFFFPVGPFYCYCGTQVTVPSILLNLNENLSHRMNIQIKSMNKNWDLH